MLLFHNKSILHLVNQFSMIDEESLKRTSHIIRSEGEHNARLMFKFPTALETKVKKVLDDNNIKYSFQKLLYRFVKGSRNYVEAYYIANFWLPRNKLILDIQKDKRKVGVKEEGLRTFSYDNIRPAAQVLKLDREAIECPVFEKELMAILK